LQDALKKSDFHLSEVTSVKHELKGYKKHRALDVEPPFELNKQIPTYETFRDAQWTKQTGPPGWTNDYARHWMQKVRDRKTTVTLTLTLTLTLPLSPGQRFQR